MTIIHISVDTDELDKLKSTLSEDNIGVITEALTLLNWAVEQRQKGRIICSVKADGNGVERLSTKNLDYIKKI